MDDEKQNLSSRERIELTVESGLQLIPYVGGAIASAYFGTKNEKRFKRLESFYEEVSHIINDNGVQLPNVPQYKEEDLISLIESLNDKIEKESREEKRSYFKRYFVNTLLNAKSFDYDKSKIFLEILDQLSFLDIEVLTFLRKNPNAPIGNIQKSGIEQYAIVGAIGRLRSFGFLISRTGSLSIGGGEDNLLSEIVSVSPYGEEFIRYCIS